jgi:hypothetical protein
MHRRLTQIGKNHKMLAWVKQAMSKDTLMTFGIQPRNKTGTGLINRMKWERMKRGQVRIEHRRLTQIGKNHKMLAWVEQAMSKDTLMTFGIQPRNKTGTIKRGRV